MKPLDPKLLRFAAPARRYVALTAGLGVLTAALVVVQALVLANVLAPVIGHTAGFTESRTLLGWLIVIFAARVLVVWAQERFGQRAGVDLVADLRSQVVTKAIALGPRWLAEGRGPEVVTLATRGLDDLQPYVTRYLPQLLLAATVTPASLLVVLRMDWLAAVIIIVTLPLVPLFMVLVGRLTQGRTERRLASMRRLGSQVLDLLAGIPTLRALHREHGPEQRVRQLGDAYRQSTMGTLRIAFLSGLVLELLTTLSVAIVAVAVGLRLVNGGLDLTTGLAVIILAPEVYLPIRQIGTHFHASTDGIAAANSAFEILEVPLPLVPTTVAPDMTAGTVRLTSISVAAPGRDVTAPSGLSAEFRPGQVTGLVGPNGSGKTTALLAMLGLVRIDQGSIDLIPAHGPHGSVVNLSSVNPVTWWSQVTWLPQRPWLAPGTIASNVGLRIDDERIPAVAHRAAQLTGLDAVIAAQPLGWQTVIGQGGVGLSVGQRQRVALTKALVSPGALVILDEPTAHLDGESAEVVATTINALRDDGRAVVLVSHRPELVAICDTVVEVHHA